MSEQLKDKTYQWPREGSEHPAVGTRVLVMWEGNPVPVQRTHKNKTQNLMQPLYQTNCEWVDASELREYIGGRGT